MDERVLPAVLLKQRVRRASAAVEVAVGFVNHQGNACIACQIVKGADQFGGVFHAAGIVRGDQRNRTGARCDQGARSLDVGQQIVAGAQGHGCDAGHVQPHLVIEVPGRRQDHLVTLGTERGDGGGKGLIAARGNRNVIACDCRFVMRADLGGQCIAQGGHAQHGAIKVRIVFGQRRIRHRLTQCGGRRVNRCGLAHVDQRAVGGMRHTIQPATCFHDGRGECGGGAWQIHRLAPGVRAGASGGDFLNQRRRTG